MSFNATRLTCFALISAIETDFREAIMRLGQDDGESAAWPAASIEAASQRLTRERGASAEPSRGTLVNYLDFADSYQILLANKSLLSPEVRSAIQQVGTSLESLIQVRNRVAHSRPMEVNDLPLLHDTTQSLVRDAPGEWAATTSTLKRLQSDPAFVLGLTISLPGDPIVQPHHNLPIPDFDETGFYGRGPELRRVKKAILGAWPVVSILGDGGIGKTSIALKVAYDLLDDRTADFDSVVWVTAKSTVLSSGEIQEISGAIRDSMGLFEAAARELGAPIGDRDSAVEEVLGYLQNFKILLILDNLETVTDQRIRDFLLDLPSGSKVLITSRIGLGIENPIKLEPLSPEESRSLLRALASIRNVPLLKNMDEGAIAKLVEKLRGHPLYIKWLVSGVQAGRRPAELVNDNSLLLDFCMSNVFDKLGEDPRRVLNSMQIMRGPREQGELAFLNSMTAEQIQVSLLGLMTTNFVAMRQSNLDDFDTTYETTDFASQYLARHRPVERDFREEIVNRSHELAQLGQQIRATRKASPYDSRSVDIRGQQDAPAAKLLVDAQRQLTFGNVDEAVILCHEAQTLSPSYYEAWRVEGTVQARRHDRYSAVAAFEKAYGLSDNSPIVGYHFGVYLVEEGGDADRGLEILQAAARRDQGSPAVLLAIASAHFSLERYLECLDTCLALVGQRGGHLAEAIMLAVRAGVFGSESMLWQGHLADGLAVIETVIQVVKTVAPEDLAREDLDYLAHLRSVCSRYAAQGEQDPYLSRTATELEGALTDRIRVANSDALSRLTGQVVQLVADKHFGFVKADARYFFHHNDLVVRQDWELIAVDQLVAFSRHPDDSKGPKAAEVRVLS